MDESGVLFCFSISGSFNKGSHINYRLNNCELHQKIASEIRVLLNGCF